MTNIFCIIGSMEASRVDYINLLFDDAKFINKNKLVRLIFGTTNPKTNTEIDDRYYTITKEEFEHLDSIDLIEYRSCYNINIKDDIYYFTKRSDIYENKDKNLICIASPYQYESYKSWTSMENIKNYKSFSLNCIYIERNMKEELLSLISKAQSEDEIQEICSRAMQEKIEYDEVKPKIPELFSPRICENTCIINSDSISTNVAKIKDFISFTIDNNY